jgi:hypothetical protein
MPSTSSLLAIQTAVMAVLVGDATLVGLLTSVDPPIAGVDNILNYEPQSPPSEFIVVANATEQGWNTLGGMSAGWGWEVTLTVHIYSYYAGDIKALQILNRVTALLNKPDGLAVTGYGTAIFEYGDKLTKVLIETKDKQERRHIPAVFSIKVHE